MKQEKEKITYYSLYVKITMLYLLYQWHWCGDDWCSVYNKWYEWVYVIEITISVSS